MRIAAMERLISSAPACSCKKEKEIDWKRVIIKLFIKLCVSAFVKIFVTKIIVDSIRR